VNRPKKTTEPPPEGGFITALKPRVTDPSRVGVVVDGRVAVTVGLEDLVGVGVGDEWGGELRDRLIEAGMFDSAKGYALNALSRKPMSRGGLKLKFRQRRVSDEIAERVLDGLEQAGLINDELYAGQAARTEVSRRPAGKRLIEAKLRAKGIDPATARAAAAEATADRDPVDDAVRLIEKKARLLRDDPVTAKRRLGGLLARRGFDYEVARAAIERVLKADDD